MEKNNVNALFRAHLDQLPLRLVQGPARRDDAAVLVAVGIADHDHLPVVQTRQVFAVKSVTQQTAHALGHADDEQADRGTAVLLPRSRDRTEHFQCFGRLF